MPNMLQPSDLGYGPPTYKQYERSCDQWQEWKRQAATLDYADLARHASVSTSNAHECVDCFCCAALAVKRELDKQRRGVRA